MYAGYFDDIDPQLEKNKWRFILINYKFLAEITCEAAETMNVVITLVTFTLLTPFWKFGEEKWWESWDKVYDFSFNIAIHSIPLISSTINSFILSDSVGYMSDAWLIPIIAVIFTTISGIYTYITGINFYPFLSFKDWTTPIFLAIVILGAFLFHIVYALISQLIKWRFEWDIAWLPWQ